MGGGTSNYCRRRARVAVLNSDCDVDMEVLAPATKEDSLGNILGSDFIEMSGMGNDYGRTRGVVVCDQTQRDPHPPLDHHMRGMRLPPPFGTEGQPRTTANTLSGLATKRKRRATKSKKTGKK